MVTLLLDSGVEADQYDEFEFSFLERAVRIGKIESAKALLEHGVEPEAGRQPALLTAASLGRSAMVDLLLDHGADIGFAHDGTGATALMSAAAAGRVDVIRTLIERDADVDDLDELGRTLYAIIYSTLIYT